MSRGISDVGTGSICRCCLDVLFFDASSARNTSVWNQASRDDRLSNLTRENNHHLSFYFTLCLSTPLACVQVHIYCSLLSLTLSVLTKHFVFVWLSISSATKYSPVKRRTHKYYSLIKYLLSLLTKKFEKKVEEKERNVTRFAVCCLRRS